MKFTVFLLISFLVACFSQSNEQPEEKFNVKEVQQQLKEMRGFRYGEILVSNSHKGILHMFDLTAYNTLMYGCDLDLWHGITEKSVAKQFNSVMVKLNGPRFWMMDTVSGDTTLVDKEFTYINDLKMVVVGVVRASLYDIFNKVVLGAVDTYKERAVKRKTTYVFRAGRLIYTLTSPEGKQYIMQSASAQYAPLTIDDLAGLGARLKSPPGWVYRVIKLESDLHVTAKDAIGRIVTDEFFNTYSLFDSHLLEGNIREEL